jgi:Divergent InlB B-repeat domain
MLARQKCLVVAAVAGAVLLVPRLAPANDGRAGDPHDVRGALDIAAVSHTERGGKLVHTIRAYRPFPSKLLKGGNLVAFAFDQTDDGKLDRLVVVLWTDGALRGVLADTHGTVLMRVPVSRPDSRTIRVTLLERLLGAPPTYRWSALTTYQGKQSCRKACIDLAPNRGLLTHRVYVPPALSVTVVGPGRVLALGVRPPIDCPTRCQATFHRGQNVALRPITPGPDLLFTGWSGACTGTAECVVKMDANTAVTATFVPQYVLTLAVTGGGYLEVDPSDRPCSPGGLCTYRYPAGTVVTLRARLSTALRFDSWSGACSGIAPVCTITMDGDKAAFAAFGSDPIVPRVLSIAVDTAPGASGRITSDPPGIDCPGDCTETYFTNTLVTLAASPAPGSAFLGWSGSCRFFPSSTTCLVGMGPSYGADVAAGATFGPG